MKIHVLEPLTSYDGATINDGGTPLVFRAVFGTALNSSIRGEEIEPEQKARLYALTVKLYQSEEVEIDINEAVLIQERVGKVFGPLVYGRVCDLLNGRQSATKSP